MRIVAGMWRGRVIQAPKGRDTRPTSDRVREALFSSLEARIGSFDNVDVLDAFAGSGALALEALSRGARSAVLVESDRAACTAIRANIECLGANAVVVWADILKEPTLRRVAGPYSLLLLDPPYRIDKSEVRALIERLQQTERLSENVVIVWEHAKNEAPDWPEFVEVLAVRTYGSTEISIGVTRGGVAEL